jgi:hypothetical protein
MEEFTAGATAGVTAGGSTTLFSFLSVGTVLILCFTVELDVRSLLIL